MFVYCRFSQLDTSLDHNMLLLCNTIYLSGWCICMTIRWILEASQYMRKLNMWFPDNSVLWLPWLRKSVVWLAQPCRRLSENRTMRFPAMTISTLVEVKYIGSTMLTCDKDQYKNKFGDESECITSILSIYDTRFFIIPWHKMHPTTFLLSSGKSQESLTLLCALRADAEKKLSQPKPEAPGRWEPAVWRLCNLVG